MNSSYFKKGHKTNLGRKSSEEKIKLLSESHKGIKHTEEAKKKIGLAKLGNKFSVGRNLSQETKLKMSLAKRGEKSVNWKGGITPINSIIRRSLEYRTWRTRVFERDNYTCVQCRKTNCYLEADHIKSFAYYPDLRFVVDNGRTLCLECHEKTPNYKKKKIHDDYGRT